MAPVRQLTAPTSSRSAALRAATGFGVTVFLVAIVELLWHDAVDLTLGAVLLGSLSWLYQPSDRHSRLAIIVAGALSIVVGAGLATLLSDDFSHDVASAGLGALAASQAYAAITRPR